MRKSSDNAEDLRNLNDDTIRFGQCIIHTIHIMYVGNDSDLTFEEDMEVYLYKGDEKASEEIASECRQPESFKLL